MEEEEEGGSTGAPAWMATFADLMSLLLTFFVLLLSFANMDVMKFQGMVGSMREAFGVKYEDPGMHVGLTDSIRQLFDKEQVSDSSPSEDAALKHKLRKLIERQHLAGQVEVTTGKDGLTVRVEGELMFAPGTVDINPSAFVFLDEMAAMMRELSFAVTVEGHTDDTPPGAALEGSNWQLSSLRSANAVEYLTTAGGVTPSNISARGFGSSRPLVSNKDATSRKRNRRIEFVYHRVKETQQKTSSR